MVQHATSIRKVIFITAAVVAATSTAVAADAPTDPNPTAIRRAITELSASYGNHYPRAAEFLERLAKLETQFAGGPADTRPQIVAELAQLRREALLANPAIDFDRVLLVKRHAGNLALPANWQGNSSLGSGGAADNELAIFSLKAPAAPLQRLYKPDKSVFVGDVDLHFDAGKVLFSSIGTHGRWQIFEMQIDGTGLRQITPADIRDIDHYDACYLPDGRIIFDSSSGFTGVPCVGGSDYVGNLHIMNADGSGIRRLCFDQDNDWCPTVMPNGRVMYLRWEYTDSAHYFSRVLMSMNPDGTNQAAYYGSNSYWPNSLFYARPIPGTSSQFVGIVSGHHGTARAGELVIFDANLGRESNAGVVQRIPGHGKPVEARIKDGLVDGSWPKFLHPFPLNSKFFLVSAQPTPRSAWGLYLVDVFDNMLLLREEPGHALFEPLPVRKTPVPPIIPDKVRLDSKTATVYLHDIYSGPGLAGVPRGTVRSLRLFEYEYSYRNMGGHYEIGIEGPWDVRQIIGTVPVNEDGSAAFQVPANRPISIQPLDAEGKALQQMRSWFTAMPGEYISCVGCHEKQNSTSALTVTKASRQAPAVPTPWYGPQRGFSFIREVQPVLDRNCIGCHSGAPDQQGRPDLSDPTVINTSGGMARFPKSYVELHPYVRRNGPEGDYHLLTPLEFHTDTSPLVKMLDKGHHNVKLSAEDRDRLFTWIDLNVPAHGTWHEVRNIPGNFAQRRREMDRLYAGVDLDIEAVVNAPTTRPAFQAPAPEAPRPQPLEPIAPLQANLQKPDETLDLGNGIRITLKYIPAGEFIMGSVIGARNEFPQAKVQIRRPFWIGTTEVSLQQYQQFDPNHRNGYYDMHYKDQVKPGYLMDLPQLPAIRVSYTQAVEFCRWLSARTGRRITLPTEAQWEYAARAGTSSPFYYGDLDTDFAPFANLADATISQLAVTGVDPQPIKNPDRFWDFELKDARFNDGVLHLAPVGKYKPNAWGIYDTIGNVAEWTSSDYLPYPYTDQSSTDPSTRKTVRGGAWSDRPRDATVTTRWSYPQWQRVFNVGFRVVMED